MPDVRALPSTGITRRQRSYHPLRLPSRPPAKPTLRPQPSPNLDLPRLPEQPSLRAAPTTPTNRNRCVCRFPSRSRTAFPESQAGRRSQHHFRGLLRLHSCCGPQGRSTATKGSLCHRASMPPVTQRHRLPATKSNRLLSGWILPPLVVRALGAL